MMSIESVTKKIDYQANGQFRELRKNFKPSLLGIISYAFELTKTFIAIDLAKTREAVKFTAQNLTAKNVVDSSAQALRLVGVALISPVLFFALVAVVAVHKDTIAPHRVVRDIEPI